MQLIEWLGTAATGGTAVGVSVAVLNFILKHRKLRDDRLAAEWARFDTATAAAQAKLDAAAAALQASNVASFAKMEARLDECEKKHAECEEHERKLEAEVVLLKGSIGELQGKDRQALIECDEDGMITSWNQAATTLFQWERSEAIGKSVTMLIPHELRRRHSVAFPKRVARDKESIKAGAYVVDQEPLLLEAMALRRDGTKIPIAAKVTSWEHKGKVVLAAEIRRR